ncbi:MAG: hypothetical protein KTV77_04580 [Wolbachia endosymbiont of Fragariocoptes setiger]|nr:hypothetical protein [Wolbachia endosymbiont of Fragariocoptes setiger]
MSIQSHKILAVMIIIFSFFLSYSTYAETNPPLEKWTEMKRSIQSFIKSLSDMIPSKIDKLSPMSIVGIFIAIIFLAIMLRGVILFITMFAVLTIMFGSTEKVKSFFKEKFSNIELNRSDLLNTINDKDQE